MNQSRSDVPITKDGMSRATIVALLIASAQAPLGSTLIAVALPSIGEGFHADIVLATSLLVTSYLVINIVCQGPGGKIGDLFGSARALQAGILLYAAGAAIGLMAPSLILLVLSRCTMALAGAVVVPSTLALLRLHVPVARRGQIFGWFGATMGLSAALGPALGGEIVAAFGWRAIFMANLPFLAIAWGLLRLYPIPNSSDGAPLSSSVRKRFDIGGMVLFLLMLAPLIAASKIEGTLRPLLLIVAAAATIAFIRWESRADDPILDPALFVTPAFAAGAAIMALQNFAMYGLLFELPQFFVQFRGTGSREVGYLLFVMMVGMVGASPIGGRLTDRIGPRRSALIGSSVLLSGSLMLCRLADFDTPAGALLPLLVFGIGMGLCSAPAQTSCMAAVKPAQAGMAAGASSTARYLGGIATILVLGAVLGSSASATVGQHEVMQWLFAGAVLISVGAGFYLPGQFRDGRPR